LMKCGKSRTSGCKVITKNDPMTRWKPAPAVFREQLLADVIPKNCGSSKLE
jgi:hypothetical protein